MDLDAKPPDPDRTWARLCFAGEQLRLQVGGRDFHLDLLFFHRTLQCLVAFDLKVSQFEPERPGKTEFYLEALEIVDCARPVPFPPRSSPNTRQLCRTSNSSGGSCMSSTNSLAPKPRPPRANAANHPSPDHPKHAANPAIPFRHSAFSLIRFAESFNRRRGELAEAHRSRRCITLETVPAKILKGA